MTLLLLGTADPEEKPQQGGELSSEGVVLQKRFAILFRNRRDNFPSTSGTPKKQKMYYLFLSFHFIVNPVNLSIPPPFLSLFPTIFWFHQVLVCISQISFSVRLVYHVSHLLIFHFNDLFLKFLLFISPSCN